MATLERKKKQIFNIVDNQDESSSSQPQQEEYDDLTNDPVLEKLSKEPMEYLNSCLTQEVVESLHSVKNICLTVLDLLLLQMVNNLPNRQSRRLSDPFCHNDNVLSSISQNTNLLQELTMSPMTRSKSSPTTSNISDIYKILDSDKLRQQNDQDYTLCCSLAALLNNVYRLLELDSQKDRAISSAATFKDVTTLQEELHAQVSTFQQARAAGIMSITEASQEMLTIWDEMDQLMNIVCTYITQRQKQEQSAPPAYDDKQTQYHIPPPAYDSVVSDQKYIFEKKVATSPTVEDLDHLLNAIDRLFDVAPALNDQRVSLSENQVKKMTAATLGKTIQRLSRGRMEDQDQELLQDLIQQIQKSASRSLDNQRVKLTPQQQKNMDFASVRPTLDRLNKGRYTDQDWISHEENLINDLTHTADLLAKSFDRPAYNKQRFYMSDTKERNLFMYSLFNKVESLEGYRLVDQDAELPLKTPPSQEHDDDFQQLLNYIYKSTKPQLDNQRASFTY